ncbi:hypothetical protein D3C81_1718550 [compost metagenome]
MQQIQYLRRLRFPLDEIRMLLTVESESWVDLVQARLAAVQSEKRVLSVIEHELLALQRRVCDRKEHFDPMDITTEYQVDTFELKEPIYVIGPAERFLPQAMGLYASAKRI